MDDKRKENGLQKFDLGYDQECSDLPMKKDSMETQTMPMPTGKTQDAPKSQDGGLKAWKPMGRK